MGQVEPTKIDVDELQAKLDSPEYAQVAQSLREIGIQLGGRSVLDLRRARATDLAPWLKDAVINRDRNLRLQYLAGHGLEPLPERPDLRRHAAARAVSGATLHGFAGDDPGRARRDSAMTGRPERRSSRVYDWSRDFP